MEHIAIVLCQVWFAGPCADRFVGAALVYMRLHGREAVRLSGCPLCHAPCDTRRAREDGLPERIVLGMSAGPAFGLDVPIRRRFTACASPALGSVADIRSEAVGGL